MEIIRLPQKCRLKLSDGIFIKWKTPCACRYVVISMQAGIQTCPHGNLSGKTVSSVLRSRFPLS
ncbi:TPA: hypothetical protein ACKLP0_001816, partial [Neisseria gonorrhoeae]